MGTTLTGPIHAVSYAAWVVSRRVVVGAGAVVLAAGGGLVLTDRHDDVLRALGARPHPVADPDDTALLRTVASEQADLVGALEGLDDAEELVTVLREQLEALGGAPGATASPSTAPPSVEDAAGAAALVEETSRRRERDALVAVSPDLARVLASLAAGLAQVSTTLGARG